MSTAHLADVVDAAQRVAGCVAARGRGDREGAAALLSGLDQAELSSGALLVADLALNLLRHESGESLDATVGRLCLEIEHTLGG